MQQTATNILTKIYESAEVKEVIKKLRPVHLQEDILQHTFLELFQKEDLFIIDLYDRGKLKAYIVKILYNTATYHRTPFEKLVGKETPTDFCGESKYELIRFEETEKDRVENYREIACAVSKLEVTKSGFDYKATLLREYAELGTYQAVADKTGIPLSSVFKTITEARKEVKRNL